jgi:recombination protein RecR
MQFSSALLETAVNEFAKLPGIGKKTALRLVLHLLKQDPSAARAFGETVLKCVRISGFAIVAIMWPMLISFICQFDARKDLICVVNHPGMIAIETTQQFSDLPCWGCYLAAGRDRPDQLRSIP